jgi:hypothetical protein
MILLWAFAVLLGLGTILIALAIEKYDLVVAASFVVYLLFIWIAVGAQ